MDNPEKLATLGTQKHKTNTNKIKNTTQYVLDTTIRIRSIKFTHIHQWNHIQNKQFTTSTVENSENDCELQWAEIQTKNKSVIIGSYYRPPNSNLDALNNLKSSIANVSEHSKDKPIILAGDFNLPHIDWENNTVKTEKSSKPSSRTNRNY
jgi:endonuclease/exonuclease/phosphatase (EEP) superfamily protein YafD